MRALRLRLLNRLVVMVGGEAMQSGFHFALNIVLIHMMSAHDYGIFAIGMVMGGIGLSYIRSLTAVPASIWIGRSTRKRQAYAYDVTFSSAALVLSVVMGIVAFALLQAWDGNGAVECGVFVALWSLRSHLRTSYFAHRRQWLVSISDLAFTVFGVLTTALVFWYFQNGLPGIFASLAIANGLGVIVLLVGARLPARISYRASVRRRMAGLWRQLRWSAFGATTTNIQGQCLALLVAGFAGPAAYAPIAAVLVFFAPLRIIATAFVNMMQPELSSLLARGQTTKIWQQSKLWSVFLGVGGVLYGAAVIVVLPFIKSQAFENASIHFIGIFAFAIFFMTMLYVMPRITLEVMSDFKTVAIITSIAAVIGLVSVAILLAVAAPPWSLAGAALSEAIVLLASWFAMRRRLRAIEQPTETGFVPLHREGLQHVR